MSGAELLAVVGGIAAFSELLKTARGIISWIRTGPSGECLSDLISDIELRLELLDELQKSSVNQVASQSEATRNAMDKIKRQLQHLQAIGSFEKSLDQAKKRDRARHVFRQPSRMKKLQQCLLSLDKTLELVYNLLYTRSLNKISVTLELPQSDISVVTKTASNSNPSTSQSGMEINTFQHKLVSRQLKPWSPRSSCSRGTCVCPCHYSEYNIYHRNPVQGSPWASLFTKCSCSTKAFSWRITAFQRQVSFIVSLAYERSFSLSPSLRICNTVPNTAPLFVVLYKCKRGYMRLEQAMLEIERIMSSGQGSPYDVNRNGVSWIEELIRYPWDYSTRHIQFYLLNHFMAKGIHIESETLLLHAIRWIGEGPHMSLLETILPRNGNRPLMDPMKSHTVLFQKWPTAFDSNWICLSLTEDPFFIEALSLFVNHDPDFGDTGYLQRIIHAGDLDAIRSLLSQRDLKRVFERNFLRQSALHISIKKPKILNMLLSNGFNEVVDSGDRNGATALMYAAAYGDTISAIELLRAGANSLAHDNQRRNYLNYALEVGRFNLIEDIFNFYDKAGDHVTGQLTLDAALHCYIWSPSRSSDPSLDGLRRILQLGAKPNWITDKGNTLFHAINSADQAILLLEYDSLPTNSQNTLGYTPLMVLSWLLDVELVRKLLSAGVQVKQQDRSGQTVFEHLFRANQSHPFPGLCLSDCRSRNWFPTFQIAIDLLQAGADFGTSDCCKCYCSSQGCTALHSFFPSVHSKSTRSHSLVWIPWICELFLLLRSLRKSGLEILIQSLVRSQRFDEIGLTHTCCLASKDFYDSPYTSPYEMAMALELDKSDSELLTNTCLKELEELRDEQEELGGELEGYCESFRQQNQPGSEDCEGALISTLARRVVFIERGSAQAAEKANLQRHVSLQETCPPFEKKWPDTAEILSAPSFQDVIDYENDEFTGVFQCSSTWDPCPMPCIEDLVDDYLQSTERFNYAGLPVFNNEKGHLHHERQRLCRLLVQEIKSVRKISDEDADWTLDIVSEDL